MARCRRSDVSPLKPVVRLPDGRVKVDALLTRAGIFLYANPDGSVRRELRPPDEVFRPDSMRSLQIVPLSDDHPPEMLTASNAMNYAKGSTGDTITRDDDHLRGPIGAFDAEIIAKMEGGKHELSCGYTCDLEEAPGVHPVWGAYDAVQHNIVYNHVALVDKGRAGSASLRMDSWFEGRIDGAPPTHNPRAHVVVPHKTGGLVIKKSDDRIDYGQVPPSSGGLIPVRQLTRKIVSPQRGVDGLFVNQGQTGPDRELEEGHRRLGFANAFNYADQYTGNTRTFDETARYNCGRCNKHDDGNSCLLLAIEQVDDAAGSCEDWENQCAGDPELDLRVKTLDAACYDIAANGEGWGCSRCPFSSPAEADSRGRSLFCGKMDARVFSNACCAINGAEAVEIDRDTGIPTGKIGTVLAQRADSGTVNAGMAKRTDAPVVSGDPDPNDLASRNARNPDRDDDEDPDPDLSTDDDTENDDSVDMYDDEGKLTPEASQRVAAASFAVPDKQQLPIHSPSAVKSSMKSFGTHEFDDADEKHAAFNRIKAKASDFSIGTTKFNAAHAGNLDRKDQDMLDEETKAKARKADKRKRERDEAIARADAADNARATAEGQIASLQKDIADLKAQSGSRNDAAETEFATKVAAKAALVAQATVILGVGKVDAKMSDRDIKTAVIKHVDKTDVAADKHPAYVDALYDGAIARATNDSAAVRAGSNALDAARVAANPNSGVINTPVNPHLDAADDNDEVAATKRMRDRSREASRQPGRMTKDHVMSTMGK